MKTLKVFFVAVIAIFFSLSLTNCKKADSSKNWETADFFGVVYGTKAYDVAYNKKIMEEDGIIGLEIMKLYNDYGKIYCYVLGLPSSISASYEFICIDPQQNRLKVLLIKHILEDGTLQENTYDPETTEWVYPEGKDDINRYYISLAEKLKK